MHRVDKAVLRLAAGMGLSVLIAYGLALPMPFLICVLTTLLLCKPGPPLPFVKGLVIAGIVGSMLLAGVLMVPLLEHYRVAGVVVTAVALYAVYLKGALAASPLKRAKVRFRSTERSSFSCKLDGRKPQPCSSPYKTKVKRGRHTIRITATDRAGLTDPSPAKTSFRVIKRR